MKNKSLIFLSLIIFTSLLNAQETEATFVSWNIQMLPNGPSMFSKSLQKNQKVRLPWIVEHCNDSDYDIIVFQEVFDIEIKRKLKKLLKKAYPYQISTKSKFGRLTSNGILIISKFPIRYIDHTIYKKGVTEDRWAAKGCTLIEAEKDGITFQIAGTHLQSGNSKEAIAHRYSQYQEISDLLSKNQRENIPVFVIGDMNTRKSKTEHYEKMLNTINVVDFPLDETEPYTIDGKNSWNSHKQGIQLDYILLASRKTSSVILKQKVLRLAKVFEGKVIDFSDHYGVVSTVKICN